MNTKKPAAKPITPVKSAEQILPPPEPVPETPPKDYPVPPIPFPIPKVIPPKEELPTLITPDEWRNNTLKEAGKARETKKLEKQVAEQRLIKVKQFRSDTLQKLLNYLSPFNNNIVNINQPLKISANLIDGTLNCSPLFTVSCSSSGQNGFNIYIKTEKTVEFPFVLDCPDNCKCFNDLLTYCQKLLVEGLSNS